MKLRNLFTALAVVALSACSEAGPQYIVESKPSELRVNARVKTLLLRTVSLPTYAADQKIAFQDAEGAVRSTDVGIWADEPERATTLNISRNLNLMTSAKVAPDPWPLPEPPQGTLDVRIETFVATSANTFRLSGQYFMGSEVPDPIEDPEDFDKPPKILPPPLPDKARVFDIVIPMASQDPASVANAQAAALTTLSEGIARDLAR